MRVERNGVRFVDHDYGDVVVEVVEGDETLHVIQDEDRIVLSLDDAEQFAKELLAFVKKAVA